MVFENLLKYVLVDHRYICPTQIIASLIIITYFYFIQLAKKKGLPDVIIR